MSKIIGNLKQFFRSEKKWRQAEQDTWEPESVFRFKYSLFKELLAANSELLTLLADVDQKLKGNRDFGSVYVRNKAEKALNYASQMVRSINVLSGDRYAELHGALDIIREKIRAVIHERNQDGSSSYVMGFEALSRFDVDLVGGKNANLGEIKNRLDLPVPAGFSVSTHAFDDFLKENTLKEEIIKKRNSIFVEDTKLLTWLSKEAMDMIESQPLPEAICEEILGAYDRLWGKDSGIRVAMRSSAVGEDGDMSFAGQYMTLLNVSRDRICDAYISIAASLYSARAVTYRSSKGIFDEELAMAVACVGMVDAVASGVMYTRHPYDLTDENILIHAVWGLGTYAVDGVVTPDSYTVSKEGEPATVRVSVARKTIKQVCQEDGGVGEERVDPEKQTQPCLTDEQARTLAGYGRMIEAHYKEPQDVEWALDKAGNIVILQTRPLNIRVALITEMAKAKPVKGYEIVVDGADIVCPGLGKGPAIHVHTEEDLVHFPPGGILIAHHSSPEYVIAMNKCKAIVVAAGSVAGHMATLAREFNVPTLIGGDALLERIPPDMPLTVDAYTGRVYRGHVIELTDADRRREIPMAGTPAHTMLKKAAQFMSPLNLVSPASPRFNPSDCRSLHDIARFCHEKSYTEIFNVSYQASRVWGWSYRLDADLPIELLMIDLGGGFVGEMGTQSDRIAMDRIASVPFKALLSGLMDKDLADAVVHPHAQGGVLSVIKDQLRAPGQTVGRASGRSYAVVADNYMNLSSKMGYHYSVVDAYCGETANENYVSFSFTGGTTDKAKRIRRVKSIAVILSREGFIVDVTADKVYARLQKYPAGFIEKSLELIGRLLLFAGQMDTMMTSNARVQWVADQFACGNYNLERPVA